MEKKKKVRSSMQPLLLVKLWLIVTLSSFATMVVTFSILIIMALSGITSRNQAVFGLETRKVADLLQDAGREELFFGSGKIWIEKVLGPVIKQSWRLQESLSTGMEIQAGAWILDKNKNFFSQTILTQKSDRLSSDGILKKFVSDLTDDIDRKWTYGAWQLESCSLKDNNGVYGYLCYATYMENPTLPRIIMLFYFTVLPVIFIFCLICGVVSSLVAAFYIRKRIRNMVYTVDGMFSGDFSRSCRQRGHDELAVLAARIDLLNNRLPVLLKDHEESGAREEKTRLSRDLHDGIKQDLFALILGAGNLVTMIGEEHSASDQAKTIEASLQSVLQEIKILISAVMPVEITPGTLRSAILLEYEKWKTAGLQIHLELELDTSLIHDPQALVLFSITREALANSARHSGANEVSIRLFRNETDIVFEYYDNGKGFDKDFYPGLGISMIKRRVRELGATEEFISKKGLKIIIHWPQGSKP